MMNNYSENSPPNFEEFKCLREDKYFVNNTDKDLLLIYPDGTMTIGMSRLKFHDNIIEKEDDEITIDFDNSVIPSGVKEYSKSLNSQIQTQLIAMTAGNPQIVENFYYGIEGENRGRYHELPTIGHPVVIRSSATFVLLLYDDQRSIERAITDITNCGGPKNYVNLFLGNEFHNLGVGIQYINFSPFDLYYASHDQRQVNVIRHMTREEAIRFINKSRDWTIIDNFRAEIEEGNYLIVGIIENGRLKLHKFEREENCTLASYSLQFADSSRCNEIIPIFYRRRDAEFYLEEYDANPSNVYLDAATAVSERRTEEAVTKEVAVSKKNMTAVAKICAAMVTSGLVYGVARTLIEKLIESSKKKEIVDSIMRSNQIGTMIRNAGFGCSKNMMAMTAATGVVSKFSSAYAVGLSSVATAVGVSAPLVIVGVGVIILTTVLCVKFKDKIKEFIEDHPVIEKVVEGVKTAAKVVAAVAIGVTVAVIGAAVWVGKKIWEGIKSVGSWLSGLFGI